MPQSFNVAQIPLQTVKISALLVKINAILIVLLTRIHLIYLTLSAFFYMITFYKRQQCQDEDVPTFAVPLQFRVAERVTCHNSGKSLWLDLQANSWCGMVEWQWLELTPSLPPPRLSVGWLALRRKELWLSSVISHQTFAKTSSTQRLRERKPASRRDGSGLSYPR